MSGKRIGGGCPYNNYIDCEKQICEYGGKCGWHPLVKEYRRRLMKKGALPMKPVPVVTADEKPDPMQKREREKRLNNAISAKERRDRLIADGRCIVCGKPNDRDGKTKCAACWEREQLQRKLRAAVFE